jgi:hypothetical protein
MYFRAIAGMVAGLCAGVISGIMFLLMRVPSLDGMTYSVLAVISRAVGTDDPAVGWSYHLFNAAIVGIIFALVVGKSVSRLISAIGMGLIASIASWGLANLILLPQFKDDVTGMNDGPLGAFGLATLIGYAVQGVIMGAVYLWVYNPLLVAEQNAEAAGEADDEREPLEAYSGDGTRRLSPRSFRDAS